MAGPGEPEWLPEDLDKAVAYELSQSEGCGRCGHRREDFRDEKGELHDPPRFEAIAERCDACAEIARLRIAMADQARREAGSDADAQSSLERALAGYHVTLVAFDPDRAVIDEE